MSNMIQKTAIVESLQIGERTKIWHHAHVSEGVFVGKDCTIGEGVHIGPKCTVGSKCKIQNGAQLFNETVLHQRVFIGPHVVFTNVKTPRAHVSRKEDFGVTLVLQGASIGANATILPGITIGEYAMVGAGSVVTKNVPDYTIVVGNPAKPLGYVCACGEGAQRGPWKPGTDNWPPACEDC